jgi:hypothetical protein
MCLAAKPDEAEQFFQDLELSKNGRGKNLEFGEVCCGFLVVIE